MASVPLAIGGSLISSLLGGIFGNRPQTTTYSKDSSSNAQAGQTGNAISRPIYDDTTIGARDNLIRMYSDAATGAPFDTSGWLSGQLSNINAASGLRTNAINAALASRGLLNPGSGPATGSYLNEQNFRVGQGVAAMGQAPQIAEQVRQQRLNDFSNFFTRLPYGTTTDTGTNSWQNMTSSEKGTQTGPGNMLGGGFSSLGSGLAYLTGRGAFGKLPGQN